MNDVMVWAGPINCDTLDKVQWQRPTTVFCKQLEGASNDAYGAKLIATGDPIKALLADAKFAGVPGALGLSGFSAAHEWLSPVLAVAGEAVSYVHLADSCFQGAGATVGKPGYVAYAKLAAAGKVRMTITSNGANFDEDIHYKGPAGSKYENTNFDLTCGSKCVRNFIREAVGDVSEVPFDLPPGIPAPVHMFRKGELYWAAYPDTIAKDPHGFHITLVAPFVNMYGAPWLAGSRGGILGGLGLTSNQKAALLLAAVGIGGYALLRYLKRRQGYSPNALTLLQGGGQGTGRWECRWYGDLPTGKHLEGACRGWTSEQAMDRASMRCEILEAQGFECGLYAPRFL